MTLDSTLVLLLGALLATTLALVVLVGVGIGVASWGWSWAARFDMMHADRGREGIVTLTANLRPKEPAKVRRLKPPGNGVRKVQPRGQA